MRLPPKLLFRGGFRMDTHDDHDRIALDDHWDDGAVGPEIDFAKNRSADVVIEFVCADGHSTVVRWRDITPIWTAMLQEMKRL
jgi:hypothetical protein